MHAGAGARLRASLSADFRKEDQNPNFIENATLRGMPSWLVVIQ